MEQVKQINTENVPTVTSVSILNGDVLAVSQSGEIIVLAKLGGNHAKPEVKKRGPRKQKETPAE